MLVSIMEREYKAFSFSNIKAASTGRVRTGIAAVFGNIDSVGDRIKPGAFARTINNNSSRVKHLWNHSWQHPPLAKIVEMREVGRDELPESVREKAPEATGGLLVKREYYNNELSNWILEAIDADDINEMSFAFDVMQSADVTEKVNPLDADDETTRTVRELSELRLYDTSDVLWGANAATVAAGAKNLYGMAQAPLGIVVGQLIAARDEIKSGSSDSAHNQELFDLIHQLAVDLGGKCEAQTPEALETPQATGDQPEPAQPKSTSLDLLKLKTQRLKLQSAITNSL